MKPDRLAEAVRAARHEAKMIYDNDRLYLERVIAPSHYLAVQVLADGHGNMIHLGEREGSLLRHNQKLIEESPASCLEQGQREALWAMALDIARLFHFQGVGSVEFLLDGAGNFHFTEIKSRIQIEHPVSEMISDVDIVAEQIRLAAGEPLRVTQEGIRLNGHAIICRINAEDPWNDYLPSPGVLRRFRLPQGPGVRVDTYGYVGCQIPVRYDSLLAKVTVWDDTRAACVGRLLRALQEFRIVGVQTNLPLHLQILQDPAFMESRHDTSFMGRFRFDSSPVSDEERRDVAAMAAVAYLLRTRMAKPVVPGQLQSGWHRSARRLPV